MKGRSILLVGAVAFTLVAPASVYAQGVIDGSQDGAEQGVHDGGPVGGVVGGAAGAVTGGINGLVGIRQRPRFHQYVIEQHRPSFRYAEPVAVGTVLPDEGVEYYQVPTEYGQVEYRYTVVNDEVVLVDPTTRRIVEVMP